MVQKITLPNGVRIVHERIEHVRSAAVGIWVGSGSRHEPKKLSGISHFIEHMVFKGTKARTAAQIASMMDAIGGQVNAFTTKECTCFYARALDTHLCDALDILLDIFLDATFSEQDADTERGVILEEIGMYNDSPEDLVSERLFEGIFKGTPLGRPILGRAATLKDINGEVMRSYMRENYLPSSIVVGLCGSFSDADLSLLSDRLSRLSGGGREKSAPEQYRPAVTLKRRAIEQNHVCIAFPGLSYSSGDRYVLAVLSGILGGGMSSRLFQKIREEKGLCYSIGTFLASHEDTGVFGVYTALGRETEAEAVRDISGEIRRFLSDGPTEDELSRVREQNKANVLMGLESTVSRMNHLARSELFFGKINSPDELIACYDAVDRARVVELARRLLDFSNVSVSAVGRVSPAEEYAALLNG